MVFYRKMFRIIIFDQQFWEKYKYEDFLKAFDSERGSPNQLLVLDDKDPIYSKKIIYKN